MKRHDRRAEGGLASGMESMTTRGAGRVHYAWVILGGTALALLAASGAAVAVAPAPGV